MFPRNRDLRLIKSALFLFISLTSLFVLNNYLVRRQQSAKISKAANLVSEDDYAPGEVIVKLNKKLELSKNTTLETKNFEKPVKYYDLDVNTIPKTIKNFNEKFKISKVEKLFKKHDSLEDFLREYKEKYKADFSRGYKKVDENVSTQSNLIDIYKLTYDPNIKTSDVTDFLDKSGEIEGYSLNYKVYADIYIPFDPLFNKQWSLHNTGQTGGKIDADIDAPEAWESMLNVPTPSPKILIAVIDTGIDYTHPDMRTDETTPPGGGGGCFGPNCRVIGGYDFVNEDNDPMDDMGHGTHVAGIAAAKYNDAIGIAGICDQCRLLAIKVLDSAGSGDLFDLMDALVFAVDNGAEIINMSLGSTTEFFIQDLLNWVNSYGVIIVASAGNSNNEIKSYPAAYENVISVAATGYDDAKSFYSNYGDWVDISAPGGSRTDLRSCVNQTILSTISKGNIWDTYYPECKIESGGTKYVALQGTSMASPQVSGALGLLLTKRPELTPSEAETLLKYSSDYIDGINPNYQKKLGAGRLNVNKLLNPNFCTYNSAWPLINDQLNSISVPYAITADKNGNVYVSDITDYYVWKFDNEGNLLQKWNKSSNLYQFDLIRGLERDTQSDYIYVASTQKDKILKFRNSGEYFSEFGSYGSGDGYFNKPWDVAVDKSGANVYIADTLNSRIQKFNSGGMFINKWGSFGSGPGQFDHPKSIGIDKLGYVYVLDTLNNRVQKFDGNGKFIKSWGNVGSGDGQFNLPSGLTISDDGLIFVADSGNNRIQVFSTNGIFLSKWGGLGTGDGKFKNPRTLDIDSNRNVFVVDGNNRRVQKFSCSLPEFKFPFIGDADLDGDVDEDDLAIIKANFDTRTTEGVLKGDFNLDSWIDGKDYAIWALSYSQ